MSRKTGKAAVKARQQTRAAKMAKHKRELAEAGVKLSLPKPSAEARKKKEEELKRLYLEMFPGEKAEGEQPQKQEQPKEQPEQKEEGEQQPQPEQQEQAEEQPKTEQKEEAEQQEQADEPQEKSE